MRVDEEERPPILFRVVLIAAAIYLLIRFGQIIGWLVDRLR